MEKRHAAPNVRGANFRQNTSTVGKRGSVVKEIGIRARPEIEQLLGHPIFLELHVKVMPKWRRDVRLLERLGI